MNGPIRHQATANTCELSAGECGDVAKNENSTCGPIESTFRPK